MGESGFIRAEHRGILIVAEELDDLLDKLATYEAHKPIFQMKAEEL